jgi:hypothetical protein
MERYSMLTMKISDEIALETFDVKLLDEIVTQVQGIYPEDKLIVTKESPGTYILQLKVKKNKTRPGTQAMIHVIGQIGWEPFFVNYEKRTFTFRRKFITD